jgi:hypothetical protein
MKHVTTRIGRSFGLINVVECMGYRAGFVTMAGIAAVALSVFWVAMPETKTPPAMATT